MEARASALRKALLGAAAASGASKGGGAGGEGSGSSSGQASQFGWYGKMLYNKFYGAWSQPTTVVASGAKLSAAAKVRIERDGRVSDFKLIRPSGNVVVDESISAIAKNVTHVDPLPKGLGSDHHEVTINFELTSDH